MSDLIMMYNYYMNEYEMCCSDSEYGTSCKIVANAYLEAIERMVAYYGESI